MMLPTNHPFAYDKGLRLPVVEGGDRHRIIAMGAAVAATATATALPTTGATLGNADGDTG
jgi:hypothetical protein